MYVYCACCPGLCAGLYLLISCRGTHTQPVVWSSAAAAAGIAGWAAATPDRRGCRCVFDMSGWFVSCTMQFGTGKQ